MANRIGIRAEDKNPWERRVPLVPADVAALVAGGLRFSVEPSHRRAFPDEAFRVAGARISADLGDCGVVLAVKEIPTELLAPGRAYVFFSHTIKGQAHNMALLRRVLELPATLIDYEPIVDARGRRLVAFGRFAGIAGMIDGLWTYGQRLAALGIPSPFQALAPTHTYPDLAAALAGVAGLRGGLATWCDPRVGPLVVGLTGAGNVAAGVREVLAQLPVREVAPGALTDDLIAGADPAVVHLVAFGEADTVAPLSGAPFDLGSYRADPGSFHSVFAEHLGRLSLLVNAIAWDHRGPRLVTRADLLAARGSRLVAIADLACDIDGGIQATVRATEPGDPVYVYDPVTGDAPSGFTGPGVAVLAVDNLPCELPVEASQGFSAALRPFLPALAEADFQAPWPELDLPPELRGAVIAHQGELAPAFAYLASEVADPR